MPRARRRDWPDWRIRSQPCLSLDLWPELAAKFDAAWAGVDKQGKNIGEQMVMMDALATEMMIADGVWPIRSVLTQKEN